MKRREFIKISSITGTMLLVSPISAFSKTIPSPLALPVDLSKLFLNPSEDAGLSVVWHWTGGVVTKSGITADLEGMAASGINNVMWFSFQPGGQGSTGPIPATEQLTPEWWDFVQHMINECKRLGIRVAPHINSSWGPAGGPWVTPEISQQMLVWTELDIDSDGDTIFTGIIEKPKRPVSTGSRMLVASGEQLEKLDNYYGEVGVLAFPIPKDWGETNISRNAKVTTNLPISDLDRLLDPDNRESVVSTTNAGWIQFAFNEPFTLRAITVAHGGSSTGMGGGTSTDSYRTAHSLEIQASDDGITFKKIGDLEPMYNGWQTAVTSLTHTIPQTTAKYFRCVYNPGPPIGYDESMRLGSRQALPNGADYLREIDPLGLASILLSSTATVHHLPGKNASQWGRSRLITDSEIPSSACVPMDSIIDLSEKLNSDGTLKDWKPESGKWKVMRFGYVSQGRATGGGLQCDKFSPEGVTAVYYGWYDAIQKHIPGGEEIINILNIDSSEAGSQNWSPIFRDEFRKRRGYDLMKYLPAMAGVMVGSGNITESFLLDARRTMIELITDNYFGHVQKLAHENGTIVVSEVLCPTMISDGVEFYKNVDWTGSEFWVTASRNWKANDIADSVAGARLYGKKVIYSEAYTGGGWKEHPFALKAMGDHHYTEGVNRIMLHVWNEQYIPDARPGIPGAGTPFNHLNTWWNASCGAWGDYMKKCQALLQEGNPVTDVIYFIGENLPARALVHPKFGYCFTATPVVPDGYAFDSINRDALLNLATVQNNKLVVNGLSYHVLVLREEDSQISAKVASKLKEFIAAGLTVVAPKPTGCLSLEEGNSGKQLVLNIADEVWGRIDGKTVVENRYGNGRVCWGKPMEKVLLDLNVEPDIVFDKLIATETGKPVEITVNTTEGTNPVLTGPDRKGWGVEYIHRYGDGYEFYFLSNQEYFPVSTDVSFRVKGKVPEFWHADSGLIEEAPLWREENGRTVIPMEFDPSGSVFVVFKESSSGIDQVVGIKGLENSEVKSVRLKTTNEEIQAYVSKSGKWELTTKSGKKMQIKANVNDEVIVGGNWNITFPVRGTFKSAQMGATSWTTHSDDDIRCFSGTATYAKIINVDKSLIGKNKRLWLDLGDVRDIAEVTLNNKVLDVLWKSPYRLDITDYVVKGENNLVIDVTNTWVNRLAGDSFLPESERTTNPTSRGRGAPPAGTPLEDQLIPAGILGPIRLIPEVVETPKKG